MNNDYRKQVEQIAIDGHNYSNTQMKPVYAEQKQALNSLHSYIGMLFIKYSSKGLLSLSGAQKAQITAQVQNKLITMGRTLGNSEIKAVTNILTDVYKQTYNKNAFILNQDFKKLDNTLIAKVVNTKVAGEIYTDRIVSNKAELIDNLHSDIKKALIGAVMIDVIGNQIQNRFNIAANESKCLSDTENVRVMGEASTDAGSDSGCTQKMWSATLENHTCDECAELDGKLFDINDNSAPSIGLHPNCRCCWITVPYDGWEATQRKDSETKGNIDYTTFNEWQKQ